MTNDELQRQAELTAQILSNTTQINNNLRTQLGYQTQLAGGGAPTAATGATGGGGTASPGGSFSPDPSAAYGASYLDANVVSMQQRLNNIQQMVTDLPGDMLDALDATGEALNQMISRDYMQQLAKVQSIYGGLSGPDGVFNATNRVASKLVDTVGDVYRQLVTTGGSFDEAFGMLPRRALGDLNIVMGEFNKLLTGDSGAVNGLQLVRDMSADTILEFAGLQKAMGITTAEMENFVSRGISLTGEASMDMAREAAVFAKRIAVVTGDSQKAISSAISKIIGDTKNFGNVTVDEAARISATLREIGIGYEDLGNVIGNFQSFENAAGAVSALTTVFGVQLNAMELMTLANTDQEQFLRRIRDQFIATARSVDDMTLAEKRLIQNQLGLSNIEAVERLFDPDADITSLEALENATNSVSAEAADTQAAMRFLRDDIVSLESITAYSTERMRSNIEEGLREPFQQSAIQLEQNAVSIARSFERIGTSVPARAAEAFGEGIQSIVDFDESDLQVFVSVMGDLERVLAEGIESVAGSDLGQVVTNAASRGVDALSSTQIGDAIVTGMSSAFDRIVELWDDAVERMISSMEALLGASESPVGTRFRIGWVSATDNTVREFRQMMLGPNGMAEIAENVAGVSEDAQARVFQNNVDAARFALQKYAEHGNDLTAMSIAQMQEFASDFDLDEANAEILLGLTTRRLEAAESMFDQAMTSATQYITSTQRQLFEETTDITATELQEQLGVFGSTYSAMANQLGELGVKYSDLSEEQRLFYAEQLRLGNDFENELQVIFNSAAYRQGLQRKTNQENLLDSIESFKRANISAENLGERYLATVRRRFGIDADTFREIYENSDAEGAAATINRMLEARDMERSREAAAESGTQAAESVGGSGAGLTAEEARNLRTTAISSQNSESSLNQIRSLLSDIKNAIEAQDLTIEQGAVTIRAQDITNAVGGNPNITAGEGRGLTVRIE